MTWIVILVLAAGTLVFKSVGPLLAGGATPPAQVERVVELLTPALLASLVVTSTFGDGRALVVDPRVGGVLAGLALLWFRVPLVLALVGAAAVSALLEVLG